MVFPHTQSDLESRTTELVPGGSGYVPRHPENTLLYQTVQGELESFLIRARERSQPAPRFIEHELRAYLRCGIAAHGFLRLRCDECKLERLVPFSCKRRGFCPSCCGRRMADTAAHLVDRVIPDVPNRQWVLTLPYPLRYRCAYDAKLTSEVLRAFLRALFAELRRRVRRELGVSAEQCGAVTFIQRFGSAMNLNLHFHTLALDGAYLYEPRPGRTPEFIALTPPTADDVARVLIGTARRLRRLTLARAEGDDDALARDEPLLALLAEASLRSRIATGPEAGQRWRRLGDRVEPAAGGGRPESDAAPLARHAEMSLHAGVCVPAHDRRRLERLCRYVARPPIAHHRLEQRSDGRLALRLKTRWRDGTTHILIERRDLIDRLAPLIPPPRAHQVRYHGILAPGASLRERVVPTAPTAPSRSATHSPVETHPGQPGEACAAQPTNRRARMHWAALLQRVFAVDALRCPRCGSTLRVLAAIEDAAIARAILECLELPARAPPLAPASAEPRAPTPNPDEAFDFDQTPTYEEA
jgi:hypothetical protein